MFSNRLFIFTFILILTGLIGTLSEANGHKANVIDEITGTIVNAETGEVLSGVEVYIGKGNPDLPPDFLGMSAELQQEEPVTENSNEKGIFEFKNIEDGTYTFSITHDGYEVWAKTYTVSDETLFNPVDEKVEEIKIELQPVTE